MTLTVAARAGSVGRFILSAWLLAVVAIAVVAADARDALALGRSAIIVNARTGDILFEDNADVRLPPASMTKLMTLYLVFQALDRGYLKPDTRLPVSKRAAAREPVRLGLKAGEYITVRDAVHALAVRSANDVATVVAEAMGKTESRFGKLMTKTAQRIGMRNTVFRNASGLPDKAQVSTARDMAILARRLMVDFPHYYRVFSTSSFTFRTRTYRNHNALLRRYQGADGLKTGYTRASGYNLAASVTRDGHRLIGVVFGGSSGRNRDDRMIKLFDQGFRDLPTLSPRWVKLFDGPAPTAPASRAIVSAQRGAPRPKPNLGGDGAPAMNTRDVIAALIERNEVDAARVTAAVAVDGWSVQVGAFEDVTTARTFVRGLMAVEGGVLGGASPAIMPLKQGGGGTIFRARLYGFDEPGARTACDQLRTRGYKCVTAPPGDTYGLSAG